MKLFHYFALLFFAVPSHAKDLVWTQFSVLTPIAPSWSASAEFQPRWMDGLKNTQAVILRGTVLYRWSPEWRVGLGYGMMPQFLPSTRNESRLFEQLEWKPSLPIPESISFVSRTRFEQRWLEGGEPVGWRLREKLQVSWMPSRVGLYTWNEIFWNLNAVSKNVPSGFDQNRFSLGARYQHQQTTLEAGYLLQAVRNASGYTSWNAGVVLSMLINLD